LDKRTPFDVLKAVGINAKPAPTNSFIPRKEAVDWFLDRDGKLMVSPNCTYIREAFVGGYVYDEIKGTKETKNTPKKNKFSHGMDAVQYIALDVRSGQAAVRESPPREQVAVRYV
jgi:rubredoxin